MNIRIINNLTPIADIVAITCVALTLLLSIHIYDTKREQLKQAKQMQVYEKFVVHCLSGRWIVVDKSIGIKCTKL